MSVRMRHTRAHTRNRRSHHALKEPRLSKCTQCNSMHLRHRICDTCGTYRGKEVVDVMKRTVKLQKKLTDKKGEAENTETEKTAEKK